MRFHKVIFSPVEIEYLREHIKDARDQLCIALSKSRAAIDKQIKILNGGAVDTKSPLKHQSRIGKRPDLGIFMRSGWECDVARYFKSEHSNVTEWKYEPHVFEFVGKVPTKGAALSYMPDFQITNKDGSKNWVEVKGGLLRAADKTKLKRFKKFYPEEFKKLIAITPSPTSKTTKFFKDLGVPDDQFIYFNELKKKYSKIIPHWES